MRSTTVCKVHNRLIRITNRPEEETAKGTAAEKVSRSTSSWMKKRMRNKNPNCNHNSNFAFYQPSFCNIKYDDHHRRREEAIRKLFQERGQGGAPNRDDEVAALEQLLKQELYGLNRAHMEKGSAVA